MGRAAFFRSYLLIFSFVCLSIFVHAATKTASVSGAWSNTATWGGAAAPITGDLVNINDGVTVTYDVASSPAIGSVTIGQGASGALVYKDQSTALALNVTGSVTVNAGATLQAAAGATATGTHALNITNGSIVNNGAINLKIVNGSFTSAVNVSILGTTASLTYSGSGTNTFNNFTQGNTAVTPGFTLTANMNLAGTLTINSGCFFGLNANTLTISGAGTAITNTGTFNTNTGTVTLNGTAAQTVNSAAITIYNLTINPSVGITVSQGASAITVSNNFTISQGTFSDNGVQMVGNATGTLSVANGATLQVGIGTATVEAFPTLWTNAHIALAAGSTVNYNTTGAQPISNVPTYANLTLTGASIKTLQTGTVTINGNLNVATSGETFVDGGFQIVGNSSGTCTVASGATLQIGAAGATTEGFPTNFTNGNIFLSGSTVNYNTTGAQPISGVPTYGNLTLTGASIKTLGASTTVTGTLNIATPGETFADGGYTITVKGNVVNNASHTGTGKIYLNGGAAVHNLSGGGTFANLELNDANGASMIGPIIIGSALTNALTLTNGTFTVGAFTLTLNGAAIGGIGTNLATGNFSSLVFGPGTSNVNTGLYIPSSVTNLSSLTINIAATNKVALNSNVTLNFAGTAALTLTSGLIDLGSNNLTIGATNGTISGGTAASYILATGSGQLMKTFAAATATTFTFPIGDNATASDYTPVSLNSFTPSGGTLTVGVRVTNGTHPNMNTSTSQTNYLKRYWSFTTSGAATSYTYATGTSFTYLPSDNQGTLSNANDQLDFWDGSNWNNLNSTVTTTAATTTQQFDNVSAPLNGNDFTVRLEASKTYTWNNNAGGAWTTATNWTPTRTTPSNTDVLIFNGSTTPSAVTVTAVPSQTVAQLQVINGANVSLQSTASSTLTLGLTANTNVLTIDGTSTLQLSSTGAVATTIAFPTTPSGLSTTIAGTIILNQNTSNNNALNFTNLTAANNTITGTITNNGGVVVSSVSTTKFASGSAYTHNVSTAVAVPTAIWDPASLCSISGNNITSLFPTGFSAQTFGKFTWNCPNQTGAASLALAAGTTFAGDVTISSTGSGSVSLASLAVTVTMSGNLTLNGGTLIQNSAAAVTTLNLAGNLTVGNGTNTTVYNLTSAAATQLLNVSGSLTINSNGTLNFSSSSAGGNLSVKGDITNNGTINTAATGSVLTMNGTSPQTINAGGTWTTGTAGRLLNLNINNAAGVTLNATFAVQNSLTLTAGALTSSTLTIGVPATAVTVTRLAGSLTNVPNFNYTTGAYAINYNSTSTNYTVLNELPAAGTPTNGVLTVSTATTTVTLDKDANIGMLITSTAGATFNVNTHTLGLSLATPITNNGTITANASGSTLTFNGTVAQAFNPTTGTYTGSLISNFVVDNNFSPSGLSLSASFTTLSTGAFTVNASRFFTLAGFNLNVQNDLNNNGTITSTSTNSTITMNGSAGQNINGSGTWTTGTAGRLLNLNINDAAGVTLNATFAVQNLLTLTAGALTSSTLAIGVPATAVTVTRLAGSLTNVPNFNYTTGAYAINYNSTSTNYTVLNELPAASTPTNGILTVTTSSTTVTLDKDANIGMLTTSIGGATFNVNTHSLGLSLATPLNNTGTLTANASGSTIKLNGGVNQTLTVAGTYTGSIIDNLIVANTSSSTATLGSTLNVNNFTINGSSIFSLGSSNYVFSIAGTFSNSGTLTANGASTLQLNGLSGTQTFNVGTYTGPVINNLKINNGSGVSLTAPVNATTLTLTTGILTSSTASNFVTITGTAVTNLAGTPSATCYVNGPLARALPASLVAGSTYQFPVGASAWTDFNLINPTTNSTPGIIIKVQQVDAASGGGAATGFSTTNTPGRYWNASFVSGGANLTSAGTVKVRDAGVSLTATTVLGYSATLNGNYSSLGGTAAIPFLTSTVVSPVALGFYELGDKGCLGSGATPTTYTVGPTGNFANLTAVSNILNNSLVCGNIIFEFQSTYVGTSGETFPITFNAFTYSGGPWTVTVRPSSGVSSNLTTSGTTAATGLISFNGVSNLIFDGVPGGATVGTNAVTDSKWIISSTTTTLPTITFTGGANANTLQYMQVQGPNTTAAGTGAYTNAGVISFTSTASTTGNKNDTIRYCAISDNATGTPVAAIYSYGNSTALGNDNNTITNNNIFNFWSASATSAGINLQSSNSGWNISNNNFYQTATRTATVGAAHNAILISNTSGNGFTINNNIIGGGNATGTGTAWTVGGVFATSFVGINLSVGATTATNIENNKITNFYWSSNNSITTSPATFTGINVTNGAVNIGDITSNVIGNSANGSTGSIIVNNNSASANTNGAFFGIVNSSANGPINIQKNVVASITASATLVTCSNSITGISFGQGSGATRVVSNNIIGNSSTANSVNASNASTSTTAQSVVGIVSSVATNAISVTNNTISNLNNAYAGNLAAGQIIGINIPFEVASGASITGNNINNLSTASANTGTYNTASIIGINFTPTGGSGHSISLDTIHTLVSNYAGASAVNIVGIVYNGIGGATTVNTVERNFIHSFSLAATSTYIASMIGISAYANGTSYNDFKNNMIRLGVDKSGSSISNAYIIVGIKDSTSSSGSSPTTVFNHYFNSVYIGGTTTVGSNNSYCYYATNATSIPTRNIKNNIFYNHRSGSGSNYALRIPAITTLSSNYNDLIADGASGAKVGNTNGTDYSTVVLWQKQGGASIVTDANSFSGDPKFIKQDGDNTTYPTSSTGVSLHILGSQGTTASATPIESAGIVINSSVTNNSVTNDIDNDPRGPYPVTATNGGGTAPDVGADEGDFIGVDVTPPSVATPTLSPICNGSTSITLSTTITDASGINVTSGTKPRIYYKRNSDANSILGNTSATDGWKYVETSSSASPFSFSLNLSLLNAATGGSTLSSGDVIQYFIVAQDQGATVINPNVGINSSSFASTPTSVNLVTANLPSAGTTSSFSILPCSGTVTVGTGANYTSLTNAGGIFDNINQTTLTGNLTVNITTNLTSETGAIQLNAISGGYSVTFQSSAAAQRTITATAAATNGLIRFNGANNVTFNGGTGSQRFLLIQNINTGPAASTISLTNGASHNTFNNCQIEGSVASTTNGVVLFSTTTGSGNSNNSFKYCDIKDYNSVLPTNGVFGLGTSGNENVSDTIANCNIYNFFAATTNSAGILISTYNNTWVIQNNSFFQGATRTSTGSGQVHSIIYISNNGGTLGGFQVTGNTIGGTVAANTGTMTYTGAVNHQFAAIYINTPATGTNTVSGNIINNLSFTTISGGTAAQGSFTGIYHATNGNTAITSNTIGAAIGNGTVSVTVNTNSGGQVNAIKSDATGSMTISTNTIGSITATGTGTNNAITYYGINFSAGNVTANGNLIGSSSTANSIQIIGTATTNASGMAGIYTNESTSYTSSITNNKVYNITNSNTGTSTSITGINANTGGLYTITGNSISNLSTPSTSISTGASASVIGIALSSSNTGALTLASDTVYGLSNTSTANTAITGMYFYGGTNTTNAINKNWVHNLTPSTGATSSIIGLHMNGGMATATNNMVYLGADASGNNITAAIPITGIAKDNTSNNNFYFNSVYIGGTGVSTTATNTYAFKRLQTGVDVFKDNIFDNARSNNTTGGKHFAFVLNAITTSSNDYNIYYAPGTGGALASIDGGTTVLTLPTLRAAAAGFDVNSGTGDPNFVNVSPASVSPNLHLNSATPAEGSGTAITGGPIDDIDGDNRASNTPVDIGADAANFNTINATTDIFNPTISYSTASVTSSCGTGDRILTGVVITDAGTGVPTSGSFMPRIYFKKNSGSWFSNAGTLTAGNGNNGTWSFTISASAMGGLSIADVVSYYVIAQDGATIANIITNPYYTGLVASNVNTVTTPPTTLNTYTVLTTLSGIYTIGTSGQNYPTLTAAVTAYNSACLAGPVVFSLASNYSSAGETFPIIVNYNSSASATNTLTIKPATGVTPTISGSSTTALIILNGARYVTIDGSNSNGTSASTVNTICPAVNASRDLTITNNNSTFVSTLPQAVVYMGVASTGGTGGCLYDTIKNCNIKSGGTSNSVGISVGGAYNSGSYYSLYYGGGNNYNGIVNNNITPTTTNNPFAYGILLQGGSASTKDVGNLVSLNTIGNTSAASGTSYIKSAAIAAGWEDSLYLLSNTINGIYNPSYNAAGIALGVVNTASGGLLYFDGISWSGNEVTNATISGNAIGLVGVSAAYIISGYASSNYSAAGIVISSSSTGTNNIINNTVSGIYGAGGGQSYNGSYYTANCLDAGIYVGGGNATTNIYYNSVNMSSLSYTTGYSTSMFALAIGGSNPVVNLKNNILVTNLARNSYYLFGIGLAYNSYSNLNSNYNDIYALGSGTNYAIGCVGSLNYYAGTASALASLANWQSTIGTDANSKSVAPTYLSNADLTIDATNATNLSNLGGKATPIIGITTDKVCTARDGSNPCIGAYEFVQQLDAGVTAITGQCTGTQTVSATIKNYASSGTLNSVTVNWTVNGVAQTPVNFTSLGLAAGATVVKSLGTYNFVSGTTYTIVATTSSPNGGIDGNTSNDAFTSYLYSPGATVYIGTGSGSPAFATYSSLFTTLNSSVLTGNLNVIVQNSTTEPSTPVFLNGPVSCSGTDTIFVTPASATLYTATGNTNTSAIIGFDGASNVVIDGSYGGSGRYLKYINTNSSSTVGTVIFQNSANHIAIKNSIINLQSSAAGTAAVVTLSTSANGSTGNSYITISGDSIGDAGSYLSTSIIQSTGTAGKPNHDNNIINNSIFNFGDPTLAYGINITATGNGNNWIINGNSIFNTAAVTSGQQTGINFAAGSSSIGDSISNNYIGGSAPLCSSSGHGYWENSYQPTSCSINNTLTVVSVNAGTVTISGNTVQRIENTDAKNSGIIVFNVTGSTAATINYNNIGNSNGVQADEIVCYGGGNAGCSSTGFVQGINLNTSGTVTIDHNNIYYLFVAGGYYGGQVFGVYDIGGGNISVTNNLISGIQTSGQNGGNQAIEIYPTLSTVSGTIHIDSNTINGPWVINSYNGSSISGVVTNGAIYVNGSSLTGTINKNTIYNMYNAYGYNNSSQYGITRGIYLLGTGNWTVTNNQIALKDSTVECALYGIENDLSGSGSSLNCYYNSIYIGGTPSSSVGGLASYAFVRYPGGNGTSTGDVTSLKNNILMNNRSGGGTSSHFAIGNVGTSGFNTNFSASDYNFLASSNTSTLGRWGTTSETFANWQSATSGDANSYTAQTTTGSSSTTLINPNELFTNVATGNLHALITTAAAYAFISNVGISIPTITTTDIDGDTRSTGTAPTSGPDIGADEFNACTAPSVTTNPSNVSVCPSVSTSFTVSATGTSTLNYQWQVSTNGGTSFVDITSSGSSPAYSNYTSATLGISGTVSGNSGYQYRCVVTNSCGNATSSVATLSMNTLPAITAYSPSSFINTVCSGSSTSFGVTATGTGLTYQWSVSTNGGTSWATVTNNSTYSGATSATLAIANTPSTLDGYQYQVVVSGTCPSPVTSSAGTLNVNVSPTIGTQPTSTSTLCSGSNATFTVAATGSGLTYQWLESTGGAYSNVSNVGIYSGATTSSLTLTGVTSNMNGYNYKVLVSGNCPSAVTSSAATLNVQSPPTAVTVSGGGTYCGSSTLTATGGSGGTIYWQNTYTGGTNTTTASTSQSVSATGTYYFRAQSSAGCWGTEGSASVVILPAPNSSSTWTGTIDGDWFKYQNWTNCVPGSITDVIIPAGLTNYPNTYSANPTSNSISIASTATLTLNGGYTLVNTSGISNAGTLTVTGATTGIQLGGDWTNTGTFNAGTGTGVVKFVGTATSIITPGSSLFNHITVEKTGTAKVTLASDITTNGILKINSGVLEIPSGTTANSYQIINNFNGTINIKSSGSLRKN